MAHGTGFSRSEQRTSLNIIRNNDVVGITQNIVKEHQEPPLSPPDLIDDAEIENIQADDLPPDGGYGWVCVAACFTINCFTWGTVSVSGLNHTQHRAFDFEL